MRGLPTAPALLPLQSWGFENLFQTKNWVTEMWSSHITHVQGPSRMQTPNSQVLTLTLTPGLNHWGLTRTRPGLLGLHALCCLEQNCLCEFYIKIPLQSPVWAKRKKQHFKLRFKKKKNGWVKRLRRRRARPWTYMSIEGRTLWSVLGLTGLPA